MSGISGQIITTSKPLPTRKLSYDEFLDWLDEDTYAEWVDGEVIMASPASLEHQTIEDFLTKVLGIFVEVNDLGKLISAPFQMKLPDLPGREPDLIFVSKKNLSRFKKTFLDGAADLVIEIVSPESQPRDREEKFAEYASGGVPEYWLIDPTSNQAIFYQLDENSQYQTVGLQNGKYYSAVLPDFWLRVDWLWQNPLPTVNKTLLAISGGAYANYLLEDLKQEGLLPPQG